MLSQFKPLKVTRHWRRALQVCVILNTVFIKRIQVKLEKYSINTNPGENICWTEILFIHLQSMFLLSQHASVLCCCMLQADDFSCYDSLEQIRWLMKMLCRQQLKPKRKLPSLDSPSSRKGKKNQTHSWHNWTKCVYRECVLRYQQKHEVSITNGCLDLSSSASELLSHYQSTLQTPKSSRHLTVSSSMGALTIIMVPGTLSLSSPLLQCGGGRSCAHYRRALPYLLPICATSFWKAGLCTDRADRIAVKLFILNHIVCHAEKLHVAELSSRYSWVKWQTWKKQCVHF